MARLVSDTYLPKLLEGLSSLRVRSALCDVTLEAEGVCFPAHRIVLASASNYCKVLFVGNTTGVGSPGASIQLKGVSAAGLSNVLNFIYSNKLDLSLQNIEETFQAGETLLVREVIKLCFRFLEGCLNYENCIDVLNIAKKLGPAELSQKALGYVGQHCKQLLADPHCLKGLDQGTLCEILDKSIIEGCSELELFRATVTWLQQDHTRLKDAAEILDRIRFPLIPLRDLQRYVQGTALMRLDSGCHRYLQEALSYHSERYAQPVLQTQGTSLRSSSTVLLVAGGRTVNNGVCREMWAVEQSCRAWHRVADLRMPVYNHCVTVINDFLFVMGGQCKFDPTGKQPLNEVFRFDPRSSSWLQVASMLQRRTRFHADVLVDCIFAVGGGTLLGSLTHTVELYRPADNTWEFTAPFPRAVADHAGTTHGGILYISAQESTPRQAGAHDQPETLSFLLANTLQAGIQQAGAAGIHPSHNSTYKDIFTKPLTYTRGFSGGKTLQETYSYLPHLRRWIGNRAMAFSRCDHGMAAARDKILCIGGRTLKGAGEWVPVTEMECYCPVSNQWTTLTLSSFSCCQFSLTAHNTTLFLAGGGSLQHMQKEDSVFLYDTERQVWTKASPLPKALVDHASCMIRLSPGEMGRGTKGSVGRRRKSTLSLFIAKKQESRSASEEKQDVNRPRH